MDSTLPPLPEAPVIGTSRFGSLFRGHSDEAMTAYGAECRRLALEEASTVVEAMRDGHCDRTKRDPDPMFWCHAQGNECDFVVAWNDAVKSIRALSSQGQQQEGGAT